MSYCGVVGIDLSLTNTGLAAIYDVDGGGWMIDTTLIQSAGRRSDVLRQRRARLRELRGAVVSFTTAFRPDLVVIEAPSYGSRFGSAHDRSGLWWQIVNELIEDDYPVLEVSPNTRAKYATGRGNADKLEVTDAISEALGGFPLDDNDNVADAAVLATLGRRLKGCPVDGPLDRRQLDSLEGLALP